MNLTASTVRLFLIVTRCFSFWAYEPKHIRNPDSAMFESSSADCPMPIGWPAAFSFGAAVRMLSQVFGDIPIPFQMSCRQTTGSGT